jgi:succinyl-CoA synthetase beta subunit
VDLYEYQGKQLFARFGIPVSEGLLASTPAEAREAAERLSGPVVVKAQVLTGGRGKAGGIKLADTAADAQARAAEILGMDIRGHRVRHVWIEQASDIAAEWYFSITFDRAAKRSLFMLTTEGGIDIEQVAAERPERIARLHVDPLVGSQPYQASNLIFRAGIPAQHRRGLALIIERAYRAYTETDAVLVEINPLIVTTAGELRALDAKYSVDDNALFRHPDVAELRAAFPIDPVEARAKEKGLQYVKLDGNVGIIGNGAGLVMSTLDVVAQAGARAANFLDVGGGASADQMATSLEVVLSDPAVRSVFVNIFGGITRGDLVAQGILGALERVEARVPIVVRLDGTNAEEGRRILAEAGHPRIVPAETMLEAAERAAAIANDGTAA